MRRCAARTGNKNCAGGYSGKIHERLGVNQPYPTTVGIEMDLLDYINILYLLMDSLCAKNRGLHVFAPNLWQCLEGT